MASQLEQLLTCCICLDRFRNPKLLPCQHSVCMEPCMEGLVDYVRRQVKCPECRAEHRIPYNGVQGYPSNVTLQRFLEAHLEITGEAPDPHTGQIMERCGVCNEKNYLSVCAHCDKKICCDCKTAHCEILKREIGRINNQVKRAVHRLKEQLSVISRNITSLKNTSEGVTDEIENISKRLQKAVRDRCHFLKNEVENYYHNEHKNLIHLKEGLEQEISNVESNNDLAEKHMNDDTDWEDCELMDAKEIFLRTMDFIRHFENEPGDYNRKVRFNPPDDLSKLISSLSSLGDLVINTPKQQMDGFSSSSSHQTGLMKSKSDHRLAAQFRDQDDPYGYSGRASPVTSKRRFGERPAFAHDLQDDSSDIGRRKFRSRFIRRDEDEDRSVRFNNEEETTKQRTRVIDTEDVSRGPLSGVTRMVDSPRVIKRLQEKESGVKKKKEEPPSPKPSFTPLQTPKPASQPYVPRKTSRQISEDEIDKIKKQNKNEVPSPSASSAGAQRPTLERLNSVKESDRQARSDASITSPRTSLHSSLSREDDSTRTRDHLTSRDYGSSSVSSSQNSRKTSDAATPSASSQRTFTFSRSSSTSSVGDSGNKTSTTKAPRPLDTATIERRLSRSNSTDSNKSDTSSKKPTGAVFSTDELRNRFQKTSDPKPSTSRLDSSRSTASGGPSRYQSRFLGRAGTPSAETSKESGNEDDDEEDSSEETETEDSEETSDEEEEEEKPDYSRSSLLGRRPATTKSSLGSGHDSGYTSRYASSDSSNGIGSRHSGASSSSKPKENDFDSKYPYASKILGRSRTGTAPEEEKRDYQTSMGSSRARFEELKEKRQRLARSKSSAGVEDDDTYSSADASSSTYRSKYGTNKDPESSSAAGNSSGTTEDGASSTQLSNWARYLKNKYGNKAGSSSSASSSSNAGDKNTGGARSISRSRSSHLLGLAKENETPDDESKNVLATPTSQAAGMLGPTPFGNLHRSQYLQKQRLVLKIGSRGSEEGNFTWPRGIAVGPDNSIVVADSSNHRVQVFSQQGTFVKYFGTYGSSEGEFDCLAGVAVNRIGQYIIADRYNHRIQIFDPTGTFLRCFGSQGTSDGKFSYPWGVTTDALGFIYVCDKENHRVQVFQSDGTFVGKFGSIGNKPGQLEHPHYIAVSSTNRVIVSDSNNHRIQIFDVNGKVMSTFGSEGSDEGQFKFPRGVAVDEQGYIFVADSGNNRIQIFHPDGDFLRAFGCWGSGDGEFKGLEGVAVMPNGNILVCDRENHRIQMF